MDGRPRLLVRLLPFIDTEKCFALKGGTAINLFYRDLPRLSVDIDLLYLPMENREEALEKIKAALARISDRIQATIGRVTVTNTTEMQDNSLCLLVNAEDVRIKIELSPVIRGCVFLRYGWKLKKRWKSSSVMQKCRLPLYPIYMPESYVPHWIVNIPGISST